MEIRPFRAYRLDPAVVKDVGLCIAPPFDLIDEDYQDELYNRSSYNVIRIEKAKSMPTDTPYDNAYTRAAACLAQWIDQGVLKQDPVEAIYAYTQQYQIAGKKFTRYSFIVLGKLVPFGPIVRPHEQVFAGPVQDRLQLKRATAAQLGLVFMLYQDQQRVFEQIAQQTTRAQPLIDVMDDEGVRHIIHAITSPEQIGAVVHMMQERSCIIADGHHRYTTGLFFAQESSLPAARYQMMAFSNICQDGLTILPTHRLVRGISSFDQDDFLKALARYFDLVTSGQLHVPASPAAQSGPGFWLYLGKGQLYLAGLRDKKVLMEAAPGKSPAWYGLDVVALQVIVFERILGITTDNNKNDAREVKYVTSLDPGAADVLQAVDAGRYQVAFIMRPVRIEELIDVTNSGLLMPPKSTYFYPKMFTGLTIQRLNEAVEPECKHDCPQKVRS